MKINNEQTKDEVKANTKFNFEILVVSMYFVIAVTGNSAIADSTLPDVGISIFPDLRQSKETFKQFIENPYPVREVAYRYVVENSQAKDATNTVLVANGSLQEGTFFHRYLNNAGQTGEIWTGEVTGQSSNGAFWFLDGKAARGTGGSIQISEPGATAQIRANSKSTEGLLQLRCASWFGLRMLVPRSVKWNGDQFEALWYKSQWPLDTNAVTVTGEVLGFTNGLPTAIRLKSMAWPKPYRYVAVHYEYDASLTNQSYPVKLWTEAVLDSGSVRGQVVENIRIAFGHLNIPEGGYKPGDFLPSAATSPPLDIIASNKNVYWVQGGRLSEVGSVVDPKSAPSRGFVRWTFLSVFAGSLLILLIVIVRNFGKKNNSRIKLNKKKTTYEKTNPKNSVCGSHTCGSPRLCAMLCAAGKTLWFLHSYRSCGCQSSSFGFMHRSG